MLVHFISIPIIAFSVVGLSALTGSSETAGLFGAIIAVGCYCANVKGGA